MNKMICSKLLSIVPEKEQVIRQVIVLVENNQVDTHSFLALSSIIERIALTESPSWAHEALTLIENNILNIGNLNDQNS